MSPSVHPLPSFLNGRLTQSQYNRWLEQRARNLFSRDKQRRKAYALKSSKALYKSFIHLAVVNP